MKWIFAVKLLASVFLLLFKYNNFCFEFSPNHDYTNYTGCLVTMLVGYSLGWGNPILQYEHRFYVTYFSIHQGIYVLKMSWKAIYTTEIKLCACVNEGLRRWKYLFTNLKPLMSNFTKTRDQIRVFIDIQFVQTVIVSWKTQN